MSSYPPAKYWLDHSQSYAWLIEIDLRFQAVRSLAIREEFNVAREPATVRDAGSRWLREKRPD